MIVFRRDDILSVPGTWMLTKTLKGPSANISCPKCGWRGGLDHDIAADGAVTPSLECPNEKCDFHDMGRLDGWPG